MFDVEAARVEARHPKWGQVGKISHHLIKACNEIDSLRKGHEVLNVALGGASDDIVKLQEHLARVVEGGKTTRKRLEAAENVVEALSDAVEDPESGMMLRVDFKRRIESALAAWDEVKND